MSRIYICIILYYIILSETKCIRLIILLFFKRNVAKREPAFPHPRFFYRYYYVIIIIIIIIVIIVLLLLQFVYNIINRGCFFQQKSCSLSTTNIYIQYIHVKVLINVYVCLKDAYLNYINIRVSIGYTRRLSPRISARNAAKLQQRTIT